MMAALDGWQRQARWAGVPYAVVKKSGDDNANLQVVALAWYGFTAVFPLLLIVVTVFGFIGAQSIGSGIIRTLHQFPGIGSSFTPASQHALHGSGLGLVIGLIGLLYGAQGVTQTAQQAMATVWNIPQTQRTGFLPRLGRSLAALFTIGAAFVINAFVTTYATGGTSSYAIRIPILAGLLVINAGLYFASFALLTAKAVGPRGLLPGAVLPAAAHADLSPREPDPGGGPPPLPGGPPAGRRPPRRRPAGAGRPRPRRTAPRRPGDRSRLRPPPPHPSRIRRHPAHRPATVTWRGLAFAKWDISGIERRTRSAARTLPQVT